VGYKSSKGNSGDFNFKNDIPFSHQNIKSSKFNSVITPEFRNAYTPKEILAFFNKEKKSGRLDKKVDESIQRNAGYKNLNQK
jgi:hypothetical protein